MARSKSEWESGLLEEELDVDTALQAAVTYIGDKRNNLLGSFGRIFQFHDEPKFFQYFARIRDYGDNSKKDHGTAGGFSFFSRKVAVLKCLSEALERFSLRNFDRKSIIFSTFSSLTTSGLDPEAVVSFSKRQRESNTFLRLDPNSTYGWFLGRSLPSLSRVYLPAQLIYLSYQRRPDESVIRLPISTGAAAGTSLSAAILRGIYELIERDAFMITYLNKLPRSRVLIEQSVILDIQNILNLVHDYRLEIYVYDISTDLDVYTFLAIVVDRTGLGVALSTGLKSDLNPLKAILGAIQESFHPRSWIRREMANFEGKREDLLVPKNLVERGILWSQKESIKELSFLLSNKGSARSMEDYEDRSKENDVQDLPRVLKALEKSGASAYFVDITPPLSEIQQSRFKVVMVEVPEFQPLHLNENFPYLGGERLYNIPVKLGYLKNPRKEDSLNSFPHPFL